MASVLPYPCESFFFFFFAVCLGFGRFWVVGFRFWVLGSVGVRF